MKSAKRFAPSSSRSSHTAASLFREVKESDPVREKYPLLFLTARAPGHSELPTRIFLDLVEANRQQLLAAGVAKKNIEASPLCTNCHPELLFSYPRREGQNRPDDGSSRDPRVMECGAGAPARELTAREHSKTRVLGVILRRNYG